MNKVNIYPNLAEKLREYREGKDISQKEMAVILGVKYGTYIQMEIYGLMNIANAAKIEKFLKKKGGKK